MGKIVELLYEKKRKRKKIPDTYKQVLELVNKLPDLESQIELQKAIEELYNETEFVSFEKGFKTAINYLL